MQILGTVREKPLLKKILRGLLIGFFVYTVAGFFLLPPLLKSTLTSRLSEALHRNVSVQVVKVNPFVLSAEIKGLVVRNRGEPGVFFSLDELFVNLQSISLFKRGIIIRELRLSRPYVNMQRREDLSYNFTDLLEAKGSSLPGEGKKQFRFSVNNIRINNGSLDFRDDPMDTQHTVREMNVAIPFVSNLPYYIDDYVIPTFSARFNKTLVAFDGQTKPFADSLETSFDVNVENFAIPHYLAYLPFRIHFSMPSGYMDAKMILSYRQYKDKPPTVGLMGDIAFREIRIEDNDGDPLLAIPRLDISVASSEFVSRQIRLARVLLHSPSVSVERAKTGRINLQDLIPEKPAAVGNRELREKKEALFVLNADEISVTGGTFVFSDLFNEEPFSTRLEAIELKIDHFSNEKEKVAAVQCSLRSDSQEALSLSGEFSLVPLMSQGSFEFLRIPLHKYSPYYHDRVLFDVRDGMLDLSSRYRVTKGDDAAKVNLSELAASLSSLALRKRGDQDDFFAVPLIAVKSTEVDLEKKELNIGELATEKGRTAIEKAEDGSMNISKLLPPEKAGEERLPKADDAGVVQPPWTVTLGKCLLDKYTLGFTDRSLSTPVLTEASQIRFEGENLSTAKDRRGEASLSFILNKKGSVSLSGSVGITPPSATLRTDIKSIGIVSFQPYIAEKLLILVKDGSVSARGNLSLRVPGDKKLEARYQGEASVSHFASLDTVNAEDLLKWGSLHFGDMDIRYSPLSVHIEKIALADFYSRLIINPDGSLNVQEIMKKEKEQAVPEKGTEDQKSHVERRSKGSKEQEEKKITIEAVTLQGGSINFSDRNIKPEYSANLLELGGRISGLSSEANTLADVDLRGKFEHYAPLEIKGKVNPLRDDLYVNLEAVFRNMDLSPLTPYSGKYAGYTIEKGKLSLSLQYLIAKKKLDSQNNIFLDQFTLGDRVDSPDATKLPVKLAIALLKNRKGEITLDIPVEGSIDDPKFSIGRIILKVIVNILVKAATSPFALLGALFGGGGEELSYAEFDFGSFALSEEAQKKLDKLALALYDRPALMLEMEGHVDIAKDTESLRQSLFNKKITAQKIKEIVKRGDAVPEGEAAISGEEYPKYLKKAYKDEKFPKPRTFLGFAKDLPVPEMEKLMLTHIVITDDDLRQLASRRALSVRDYILKAKEIDPARIFLVEPKSLQPEKEEKMRNSRVDFAIK